MTTYQKFKKLNIRHSAIGLEQSDTDVTYYCTPRDAAIIGWVWMASTTAPSRSLVR